MASVGHCLVESIRIVAGRDETKVDAFAISVSAEKSLDAPGRLQSLVARVHGKIVKDQAVKQDLVKQAKSNCMFLRMAQVQCCPCAGLFPARHAGECCAAEIASPVENRTRRLGLVPTFTIATVEIRSLRRADRRPTLQRSEARTFRPFAQPHHTRSRGRNIWKEGRTTDQHFIVGRTPATGSIAAERLSPWAGVRAFLSSGEGVNPLDSRSEAWQPEGRSPGIPLRSGGGARSGRIEWLSGTWKMTGPSANPRGG